MGTISKALSLLDHFSEERPEIGLSEMARLVGADKATVYRHLSELEQVSFLELIDDTKTYRLGPAILRLAAVREAIYPTRLALAPLVTALAREVAELVHVSLLEGKALSPLMAEDGSRNATRVSLSAADRLPLRATASGIAVLSFGATDPGHDASAGHAPLEGEALAEALATTRAQGFAVSLGLYDADVTSVAIPLFDAAGRVVGAVSVAIPSVRAAQDRLDHIRSLLTAAGQGLSGAIGGRVPESLVSLWG